MAEGLLNQDIERFLRKKEFLNIATSDFENRPNVAPKFVLKVEGDYIYLIDYVIGRTYRNLKINPRVSLSTLDLDKLTGYQINGTALIIDEGTEHKRLLGQMHQRQIYFSTMRIIAGVKREKTHPSFEVTLPERVAIFKIKVEEIVEISSTGKLKRQRL